MKVWSFSICVLITGGGLVNATFCRCQPDQPCWPTEANWAALNSSIEGNLVAVKPFAYPCHDTEFNAAKCTIVKDNAYNSSYRSSQPSALQWENWEAWPKEDEQCYIESPMSIPCKQGRVSLYSAKVQTAKHVQKAVEFAARHNIKLVIRNTGHDFLGRSSAPNSLQIFTHNFKNISIIDEFVPTVPSGMSAPGGIKAVTLGAGVQLHEMYSFLASKGVMVVGGSANTVGVAGGYVQGGGHSFLGWLHGMASDNALEFQVVLANGSLIFANPYQNTDIFFALRGGGGGSFGVVVSVTVKAYPNYPVVYATVNYTTSVNGPFWKGSDAFHKHIVYLNDNGGSGYYVMIPITLVPNSQSLSTFVLFLAFVNQTSTDAVGKLLSPLRSDLRKATGYEPSLNVVSFPSLSGLYTTLFRGNDTTGMQARMGSRLVSRSFFESANSTQLTEAVSSLKFRPGDAVIGCIVAGGQVAKNRDIESGLNPAWRDTMVHLMITRLMSPNMTFDEQAAIAANITDQEVPLLESLESGKMGAYLNEADADEPDFQQKFWGTNYPRLRAIKASRDPHDLFIVRKGVGSEDWDSDGLCRV
ncbi:hypothetical protein N7532_007240 [Penicillium argentinense]|uniref:FAD-binding PCMH-type domain-containing protein n=1 Tax=Penicillium argentinense TaxID=1131581 RepID=A0A9W9K6K3_9EURO|nr:uncharacterized protein N7532_007240 [Penicillium argentinense]KAJ5094949.1 hypothetical protein N7532_007240 [Penicillium argentinense]